jgi:hypothetical protein
MKRNDVGSIMLNKEDIEFVTLLMKLDVKERISLLNAIKNKELS